MRLCETNLVKTTENDAGPDHVVIDTVLQRPESKKSLPVRIHKALVPYTTSAVLHIWLIAILCLIAAPILNRQPRFAIDTTLRFELDPVNMEGDEELLDLETPARVEVADALADNAPSEDLESEPEPEPSPIQEVGEVARSLDESRPTKSDRLIKSLTEGEAATEIGQRRMSAGGQIGEVTISLIWGTFDDLDLHVWNPQLDHVWFGKKMSRSGHLDVDMNVFLQTDSPIENYFEKTASNGNYRFAVDLFRSRTEQPVTYTVGVWVRGKSKFFTGTVAADDQLVGGFSIDGDNITWLSADHAQSLAISDEFEDVKIRIRQYGRSATTARRLLNEFIEHYPESPEAIEARKELEQY